MKEVTWNARGVTIWEGQCERSNSARRAIREEWHARRMTLQKQQCERSDSAKRVRWKEWQCERNGTTRRATQKAMWQK
jgi:hypothetical protein